METINFQKKGINFALTFDGGISFNLFADNLYKDTGGDDKTDYQPVEKISCRYEGKGVIKFGLFTCMKVVATKINGVNIEDVSVINQIEELIRLDAEKRDADKNDREKNRIAPYIDRAKYEVFNIGCDTGLIYHENEKAIKLAIRNGAKQYDVLRGERDETNKYPRQMDDFIPFDYAEKIDGKYVAKGYTYVYAEHFCISKECYENALSEIETAKEGRNLALKAKFEEAARTGKPVILSKMTMLEEDSPLASDEEGDIVDAITYAMPDGSIKTKYYHNY